MENDFGGGIQLPQDPVPLRSITDKTIFVTVPVSVSYDFDKMQQVNKIILGKLGCPGCHSGFDIRYLLTRRFEFNEKLEMLERF